MPVQKQRLISDASFTRTKHLPRPLETVYADSDDDDTGPDDFDPIDVGTGPFLPEEFAWQLIIPATLLNDGQSITFEILHSDSDQGPYASMNPRMTVTLTGAGGLGTAAQTVVAELPIGTKRYLVASATCDAGVDVSGTGSFSIGLLF